MSTWIALLPLIGVVVGALVGAVMQYWLSRSVESRKQLQLLQSQCYVDYLKAVTKSAHAQTENAVRLANAEVADAKARIAVYGTPEVVAALARFEETEAVLDNPSANAAFVSLVGAMRLTKAKAEDLKLLLFRK
jgi:hypothetical protein